MLTSNFKSVTLAALSIFCFQISTLAFSAVDQTNEEQRYFNEEYYFYKKAAGLADISDRATYDSQHALSLGQKELCKYIELHLTEVATTFEKIRNCPSGKLITQLITQMIADQKVLSVDELHTLFVDHLASLLIQHELISNRLAMLAVMDENIKQCSSNSAEEKLLLTSLKAELDSLCQRGQGMATTVAKIAQCVDAYNQVW